MKTNKRFLKIIIIGDSGVGKTSILDNYLRGQAPSILKPTIGAEFTKKKIMLQNGKEINLQLWDTAGQEKFQSLCTTFYRGSDCCVIVFDVSRSHTYQSVEKWRELFQNTLGDEANEIPIVLVGNKIDNVSSVYKDQIKRDWLDTGKVRHYVETSAMKDIGIKDLFNNVAELAYSYQVSQKLLDPDQLSRASSSSRKDFRLSAIQREFKLNNKTQTQQQEQGSYCNC